MIHSPAPAISQCQCAWEWGDSSFYFTSRKLTPQGHEPQQYLGSKCQPKQPALFRRKRWKVKPCYGFGPQQQKCLVAIADQPMNVMVSIRPNAERYKHLKLLPTMNALLAALHSLASPLDLGKTKTFSQTLSCQLCEELDANFS